MSTYRYQFLGTCAADFSPRLHGDCADCFDKNARRASVMLFNEHFLIDCGPHCIDSMRIAGVDMGTVTDLFVTHLHGDHFNRDSIGILAEACMKKNGKPLNVWVSEEAGIGETDCICVKPMKKFTEYSVDGTLKVTGMSANHDKNACPQHLLFDLSGRKFFYGCDGAWMLNDTYYHMRNSELALAVLDGTCGDYDGDFRIAEHNTIPMIRLMLPSLRTMKIINDNTEIYLSHLAPSLHKPHDETVEIVRPLGVKIAYDGLCGEV